jgi:hypothetical protein
MGCEVLSSRVSRHSCRPLLTCKGEQFGGTIQLIDAVEVSAQQVSFLTRA